MKWSTEPHMMGEVELAVNHVGVLGLRCGGLAAEVQVADLLVALGVPRRVAAEVDGTVAYTAMLRSLESNGWRTQ